MHNVNKTVLPTNGACQSGWLHTEECESFQTYHPTKSMNSKGPMPSRLGLLNTVKQKMKENLLLIATRKDFLNRTP